jgi:holo-[acyl-carrier protein] synthase
LSCRVGARRGTEVLRMIIGIGVDIVENERIAAMLEQHGSAFEDKVFTANELAYAGDRRRRVEHLAVRFAAKEAVAKALGRGISKGVTWKDIEVVHDDAGKPGISLHGGTFDLAEEMGVRNLHVSLSHTDTHSVAFVVAESR